MKILHLSTYDMFGGAARAAYRLHKGLQKINVDSYMQVQTKIGDDKDIAGPVNDYIKLLGMIKPTLDRFPLKLYRQRKETHYSLQWLPDPFQPSPVKFNSDIIHLHWICGGFKRIESLKKIKKPILWTFHDTWAFTGGCHVAGSCERYKNRCGLCPQLGSKYENDVSRWTWNRKFKAWKNLNLTIVTPSTWLANCVKQSSLFRNIRVEVIPNGIDTLRFKPIAQNIARDILNLPQEKYLILFGAMGATSDKNKGFQYLQPALNQLVSQKFERDIELLIFGASEPANGPEFNCETKYLGVFHDDDALALLYSAADVMLVPSIQENLVQTALESLACGTPVVAFNTTGLIDIVDHNKNGYLAMPYDPTDFAKGIKTILQADKRTKMEMRKNAVKKANKFFEIESVSKKYLSLYKQVLI